MTHVGDTVLDPFAGSGTTLMVAKENGRHYIGYEIAKSYYDRATEDLQSTWREYDMEEL